MTIIEKKQHNAKTKCAKGFVNGPCGGFVNGKCEADQTKDCAWVLVYKRLKNDRNLEKFLKSYIEPKSNRSPKGLGQK
ncbi:MAG: methylenetetrahydrofolate reductase C-terminal domain-containing protein [Endomicrobium sp.]|jgi:hypothetical protein|nr:methylenetetrahydrofolate reductase C-terminal domain-containing protein [Endomicrobium sp.]